MNDAYSPTIDVKRGDVFWWTPSVDFRGDFIQQGTRPVVVVSNNLANRGSGVITVVPLTTKVHGEFPQQAALIVNGTFSLALADQIVTIPRKELGKFIQHLKGYQMFSVERAMKIQLGFETVDDYTPVDYIPEYHTLGEYANGKTTI